MMLLMKSMLVLLPALMQADKPQLKGSYLLLGRSALPALGVIVQRSRGPLRSPVPPPHTANVEMPEEPPPLPLVRPAIGSNRGTGEAGEREGTKPLRHRHPLMEDCPIPWPATICLVQEKIQRGRDHMCGVGGGAQPLAGATRGGLLPAAGRWFLLPPLWEPLMHLRSAEPTSGLGRIDERSRGVTKPRAREGEREAGDTCSWGTALDDPVSEPAA